LEAARAGFGKDDAAADAEVEEDDGDEGTEGVVKDENSHEDECKEEDESEGIVQAC
jgi:hypothetical protein